MDLALIYKWVNFSIFCGALFYFLKEPIRDFLGDRREALRKELEEIGRQRSKIEKQFQEYRKKLAEADAEIEQLKKELRAEGELEKTSLIKRAQNFAQKIREDAERVAEQELNRAKLLLKRKTLLFAVDLAEEWLKKSMETSDQERLVASAIDHLERLSE